MILKLNKISMAALAALVIGGSQMAVAGDTPAFTIVPVTANDNSGGGFNNGPFAVAMSQDAEPGVLSRYLKNDVFTFFNLAPQQFNDGDRVLHMLPCYEYLDSKLCDGYWWAENGARSWRYDVFNQVPQVNSVFNGSLTAQDEMVYEALDKGTDGVGHMMGTGVYKYGYREILGVARFDGRSYILKSPVTDVEDYGDYAQAFSFYRLDDGRILVGGMARNDHMESDFFERCYYGDAERYYGDYIACPGFRTQATLWVIDPNNMADGAEVQGVQPQAFFDAGRNDNRLTFGNVRGFTKIGDTLYAVGYSMTDDLSNNSYYVGGVATYWPLTVSSDGVSFADNGHEFSGVERPGHGDKTNLYTDAKAVNAKGVVVINRKMKSSVNSNYPKVFAVSTINEDGSSVHASSPLENSPIRGANSEAAAINDNGIVVGWRDGRSENSPVNYGVARSQEGFIYNVNDGTVYYLNDLICSGEGQTRECGADGKYYAIGWPVAINNDNTILATAFEYGSHDDWQAMRNARTKTVLLKPNADTFLDVTPVASDGTTGTAYQTINPKLVVTNRQDVINEAEVNKNGRGAFDLLGLLMLASLGFGLRFGRRQQK